MIASFGDEATADLYHGRKTARARRFPSDLAATVERKFTMIENAKALTDLTVPPANRLEVLKGALKGFYSIRVNDQWRIIFKWESEAAYAVRLTDYH